MKKQLIIALLLAVTVGGFAQEKPKESKVKHLTYKEFIKQIWDFEKNPNTFVYRGKTPAIVDFYADWCGPCRRVAPIMEKLAATYAGKLNVYKVNVDQEKALSSAFNVTSIPTVLFIPVKGQPMIQSGAMTEDGYAKIIEEKLLK